MGGYPSPIHGNVSFGLMAETHSPTESEEQVFPVLVIREWRLKMTTEEDNSILVKPMFIHRQSMTSTYDSAKSIATPPPESDLDDEQTRNMLASPLYSQERERSKCRPITNSSLSQRNLSVKLISLSRKCKETCRNVFTQKRKSSQETLFDREGISSGRQPLQGKGETFFWF